MTWTATTSLTGITKAAFTNDAKKGFVDSIVFYLPGVSPSAVNITSIKETSVTSRTRKLDLDRSLLTSTFILSIEWTITIILERFGYTPANQPEAFTTLTSQLTAAVASGNFTATLKAKSSTFTNITVTMVLVDITPTQSPTRAPTSKNNNNNINTSLAFGLSLGLGVPFFLGFIVLIVKLMNYRHQRKAGKVYQNGQNIENISPVEHKQIVATKHAEAVRKLSNPVIISVGTGDGLKVKPVPKQHSNPREGMDGQVSVVNSGIAGGGGGSGSALEIVVPSTDIRGDGSPLAGGGAVDNDGVGIDVSSPKKSQANINITSLLPPVRTTKKASVTIVPTISDIPEAKNE